MNRISFGIKPLGGFIPRKRPIAIKSPFLKGTGTSICFPSFRGSSRPEFHLLDSLHTKLFGFVNGHLRRRFSADNVKHQMIEKDQENHRVRVFLHIKHEGVAETPEEINIVDHVQYYYEYSEDRCETMADIVQEGLFDLFTPFASNMDPGIAGSPTYRLWGSLKVIPAGCRLEAGILFSQGYLVGFQIKLVNPSPSPILVQTGQKVLDLIQEADDLDNELFRKRLERDQELMRDEIDPSLREALPIMARIDRQFGSGKRLIPLFSLEEGRDDNDSSP